MNAVDEAGRFRFGSHPQPLAQLNFEEADLTDVGWWWGRGGGGGPVGRWLRRMRLKQWHYMCFNHPRYFLSVAVAQLGYVGNFFVYLIDKETSQRFEMERLVALGWGIQVTPTFSRCQGIEMSFADGKWHCRLAVSLGRRFLFAELNMLSTGALALLHPLAANRGAYTHKEIGAPCHGWLNYGGQRMDLDCALGGMDYKCSYADRRTTWRWLFVSGLSRGRRYGINVAQLLYAEAENYLWLDDRLHPLGAVEFTLGRTWRIRGAAVDLEFVPLGERAQDVNLGLVRSKFRQPYGSVRGVVGGVEVNGGFGVAEEHFALW